MDYQIIYGSAGEAKRIPAVWKRMRYLGIFALFALIFGVFLWISGADRAVMVEAMEEMARTLSRGEDLGEAFSVFCIAVLRGADGG